MIGAVVRRLLQTALVLVGVSGFLFLIFFATPGADPSSRIAGRNASPAALAAVRHEFGFDRPLPVQYVRMMDELFVTRDLSSYVNQGERVVPAVIGAAPVTLSLCIGAAVLWVVLSIGVGVVGAAMPNSLLDRALMVAALVGISVPVFWLGEVVNLVTQKLFHDTWAFSWVPGLGYTPLRRDPGLWFRSLVLPWITLAVLFVGIYGRVLRADLLHAYGEDFIRTARAKGLGPGRIMFRHALRTSLVTFVSLFGLDFAQLVGGGALLTEVVFGLPGVGRLTYVALLNLDLPMIMATVMYSAFFVVLANAVVDVLYAVLDPRVRDAR